MVLRDENFFLQRENGRLQAEIESMKEALVRASAEKEALELKVDALQKSILAFDGDCLKRIDQAAIPYRAQMEDAARELKMLGLALEEKNARLAEMAREKDALAAKADMMAGEKIALRASLRAVSDELDALKANSRK